MTKILIVDDEPGILKMYQERFSMEGLDVKIAEDGQTGLDLAKKEKPDIILLDIIMPKYNGLDVLKDLKSTQETAEIPVYLLTNLPEECSGDKAKTLGASGYLVKAESDPETVTNLIKGLKEKSPEAKPQE